MTRSPLIPERARASIEGEHGARKLRWLESQLQRAVRIWELEPLAPITTSYRSVIWYVLRRETVHILKMPLETPSVTCQAHVQLGRRGAGPEVLDLIVDPGIMLLDHGRHQSGPANISEAAETLATTPAPEGAEPADAPIAARLESHLERPGRAGAARKALDLLRTLQTSDSPRTLTHGRFDEDHVVRSEQGLRLLGPRGRAGDAQIDLAAWVLRTCREILPAEPAQQRAADLAGQLGWDADRAAAWVQILHAVGVRRTAACQNEAGAARSRP